MQVTRLRRRRRRHRRGGLSFVDDLSYRGVAVPFMYILSSRGRRGFASERRTRDDSGCEVDARARAGGWAGNTPRPSMCVCVCV